MKKIFTIISLMALTFFSCNKEEGDSSELNLCEKVVDFTIKQQNENLLVKITDVSLPSYYELSYQILGANANPNNGSFKVINSLNSTLKLSDLNIIPNQTYVFYLRTVCSSDSKTDWSTPRTITFSNYCNGVSNVGFSANSLTWTGATSNSGYQVQYGITGFALGNGAILNSNSESLSGFIMDYDKSYDFYVRSFCSAGGAWSSWIGPYTHLNQQNGCNLPTNLSIQIVNSIPTNPIASVSLHWTYNGETNFEYVVVQRGNSPTSGTIFPATTLGSPIVYLDKANSYDFYVRTICAGGSRTAWTTPYLISFL